MKRRVGCPGRPPVENGAGVYDGVEAISRLIHCGEGGVALATGVLRDLRVALTEHVGSRSFSDDVTCLADKTETAPVHRLR